MVHLTGLEYRKAILGWKLNKHQVTLTRKYSFFPPLWFSAICRAPRVHVRSARLLCAVRGEIKHTSLNGEIMSKEEKIKNFDPNAVGNTTLGIYSLPFTVDEAEVVVLPVPWDVTVSYGAGTSAGPQAIFDASFQVDLYEPSIPEAWKLGIAMAPIPTQLVAKSEELRPVAVEYIDALQEGRSEEEEELKALAEKVNRASRELNEWVKGESLKVLRQGKLVALVGGEHSTPLGLLQALSEEGGPYSILQIDAHCDLRKAYEGFEFSHASIMYNALKIDGIERLVQVGIRDLCEEEAHYIRTSEGRVITHLDRDLKRQNYSGKSWHEICDSIVSGLSSRVYLSFDIDGLDPKMCPNTGTPVPGGLEFEQAIYLVERVIESGRTIIALDLNEVSPGEDEWDANVGARLLYRLINLMAKSNGRF